MSTFSKIGIGDRFPEIYSEGKLMRNTIIRDNMTGVLYLRVHTATEKSMAMIVLVNQNGQPLLDYEYLNQLQYKQQ